MEQLKILNIGLVILVVKIFILLEYQKRVIIFFLIKIRYKNMVKYYRKY